MNGFVEEKIGFLQSTCLSENTLKIIIMSRFLSHADLFETSSWLRNESRNKVGYSCNKITHD